MSSSKKYNWHVVAHATDEINFQANNMCIIDVDGKKITLAKKENQLYACAHKCPHAGGILADGFIDAVNNIVCPLHRYKFNLQNGRNTSGEGYYLKTFPVKTEGDKILVGLEEKKLFGLF